MNAIPTNFVTGVDHSRVLPSSLSALLRIGTALSASSVWSKLTFFLHRHFAILSVHLSSHGPELAKFTPRTSTRHQVREFTRSFACVLDVCCAPIPCRKGPRISGCLSLRSHSTWQLMRSEISRPYCEKRVIPCTGRESSTMLLISMKLRYRLRHPMMHYQCQIFLQFFSSWASMKSVTATPWRRSGLSWVASLRKLWSASCILASCSLFSTVELSQLKQ